MTKRVIVSSPLMKVSFHNLFVGFPTVQPAFFVHVLCVLFLDFLCLFFVAQAGLPACLPLVGLDGSPPHCSTLLCCICLILYFFVYLHFFLVGVICLMYLLGCDGWRLHCSALCSTLLCSPTQLSPTVLLFQPQERSVR